MTIKRLNIIEISKWSVLAFALGAALAGTCHAAAQEKGSAFTRTIYLVRHGAYLPDPKADPELGPGLTPLGIAQARLVAARLRGMHVHFDSITSSPMTRARETAAVMHEALSDVPVGQSPLFSECTPRTLRSPEGESTQPQTACVRQLDSAFAQRFTPAEHADRSDVIVAHGNVIRYLVTKALGVDTRAWPGMAVAHTSLTIIRVQPDGSTIVLAVGDSGHVPANMQSWGGEGDPQLVVPK